MAKYLRHTAYIDDCDIMGRYIVKFKVNWASFPPTQPEKKKVLDNIHSNTKAAMEKGTLRDWGISLDLTHGYAIWEVEADEMAKIAVLRMPYLEPVGVMELFTLEKFVALTNEVIKKA